MMRLQNTLFSRQPDNSSYTLWTVCNITCTSSLLIQCHQRLFTCHCYQWLLAQQNCVLLC